MADQIKLDSIGANLKTTLTPDKTKKDSAVPASIDSQDKESVSLRLNSLVNMTIADNDQDMDDQRVMEMKAKIQSHSYHIDTDELSQKLYQQVFAKKIG